jgi:hypothetical protein
MGRWNQPEIHDHLCERENQSPSSKGNRMSKAAGQPSTNAFSRVVDLLVEHRIKLDALEHVLKEPILSFMSFTSARLKICEPKKQRK